VLTNVLRSRAMARCAVFALTVGLAALAALALWSTDSTAQATAKVRAIDAVTAEWGQVFLDLGVENEALNDYLRAGSTIGRSPLVSALDSAAPHLQWLAANGGPVDSGEVSEFRDTYGAYTDVLRQLIAAGNAGDTGQVSDLAQEVGLGAAALRKQVNANITRLQLEMTDYLARVDQDNHGVRVAATIALVVDFLLLVLCGIILLMHQRRVERQAVESRHRALHDSLTGIGNRVLLGDRVEGALRLAERNAETVALLLLDLNRFKEINDTLGHHCGDLLLQEVASRLSGALRDSDTVARLGGDEFAVVLPDIGSAAEAREVAERLLAVLQCPADLDGTAVDVSGSIGVAVYPLDSRNSTELLQHADIAMYAAKRGHLGVAVYDMETAQRDLRQLSVLGELRRALDEHELVLHYQPKVYTGSGYTCGVEALVRWQHPQRGLLGPGEFIPLAEDSELIHPLTDYVLEAALDQHDRWRDEGVVLPLAVNVATQCLLADTFADRVAAALARHRAEPGHLTLEITESALIADPDRAAAVLATLRQLGVRLSIDDFGTGYASMAYLQRIPLDELKIDRCFITTLQSSHGNQAIVRAVLELAHALGLEVVAEGVEDGSTETALSDMGCDMAQGYHLSRPIPGPEVTAWLAAHPLHVPARVP